MCIFLVSNLVYHVTPLTSIGWRNDQISPWWRHQVEMFSALLALCAENSPVTGEFSSQRPVTGSFDVFLDLRLSKRLSTQSRRHWFETPSRTLWRHCNEIFWSHQKHPHALGCQNRRHIFRILDNDRCQTSQYDIKNFTCANWNTICSMQNFALTCLIWISS